MIKFNALSHKLKWMQELVSTKTLQLTKETFFKIKFNTTYLLLPPSTGIDRKTL